MGILELVQSRDNNGRTSKAFAPAGNESQVQEQSPSDVETPPDSRSLERHDEKEVLEHPDEINRNAQVGLQKAEAAALVYTRKVVIGIYGW